jgi:hypothetical protein
MGSRNFKYANIQQISAVVAILILGLVCPSMATVDITCSDLGNGQVQVSYDSSAEPVPVRVFALDITVSSGVIVAVQPLSEDYWVYPGEINIEECGVVDFSSPVVSPGGIGTAGITIAMASLYEGEANAPPSSAALLSFFVSSGCNVSVSENEILGGVILENWSGTDINAPVLTGVLPSTPGTYGGGSGTPGDPYLINEAEHLNAIGLNPIDLNKHFKLVSDMDMSAYSGANFNIIGTTLSIPFSGTFDGNNCRVCNFTYSTADKKYIGLFGFVDGEDALIKDLAVLNPNVDVEPGYHVGALVGYLKNGMISSCRTVGGTVKATHYVGGLVGWNDDGDIINCYSTTDVNGECAVGGLVGKGYDQVQESFSAGNVASDGNLVGGFGGYNTGQIQTSFWDKQTSDQTTGVGLTEGGGVADVNGKTTSEMKTQSTFTDAGWDFEGESANGTEDIWTIRQGQTYPMFTRQVPKGDFVGGEGVDFADFAFLAGFWMSPDCNDSNDCNRADLNSSGQVDYWDLHIFTGNWLKETN